MITNKKTLRLLLGALVAVLLLQPALPVKADIVTTSPPTSPLSPGNRELGEIAPRFLPRESPELAISATLEITRPTTSTYTTSVTEFFLTGTSNPEEDLYVRAVDGGNKQEEIKREGKKGTFGILVSLKEGTNRFEFIQNTNKKTVTILREIARESQDQEISIITENSMVPSGSTVYRQGDILILSCIAPSGASVTATVGKETVSLTQGMPADDGIPATFSTSYTLPKGGSPEEIKDAGQIQYHLVDNKKSSSYKSLGTLYIAGETAEIKGRVNTYTGFVYEDPNNITQFYELLKQGSVDYIQDQSGGYYVLSSGGYIPRYMMDIILDNEDIENQVSKVQHGLKPRGEYFVFQGTTKPAYHGEFQEDSFVFTLYNTSLKGKISLPDSVLFENAIMEERENHTVITLPLRPEKDFYWGYNVTFAEDGSLFLEFQHRPHLARGTRPLKNLSIMIDPGHGGIDVGALGLGGEKGPTESDLNLAHAYAVADELTSLGATIHITRYGDDTVELDDRLRQFAASGADLFVSLHHNSIEPTLDANGVEGSESYYHHDLSQRLASEIVTHLVEETGRKNRGSFQSYYRVTILPYAPSTLVELAFVSSPVEYEKATDSEEIQKTAHGIVRGILKSLEEPPK